MLTVTLDNSNSSSLHSQRPRLSTPARKVTNGKRPRRSGTPSTAYHYPADRFTPPREVYVTPLLTNACNTATSSRRKSIGRKALNLKLVIKTEPPIVDLTLPLPPPSPSDDPLLLIGPPSRSRTRATAKPLRKSSHVIARATSHNHQDDDVDMGNLTDTPLDDEQTGCGSHLTSLSCKEELGGFATTPTRSIDTQKKERDTSVLLCDHPAMPSSDARGLPDLLKAEADLVTTTRLSPAANPPKSPSPFSTNVQSTDGDAKYSVTPHIIGGPKEWTREDWKRLDECFTLERLKAHGDISSFEENSFDVVEDIKVEDVVARFIEGFGGAHILATMGPGWSM